jgi:hypothetical protein
MSYKIVLVYIRYYSYVYRVMREIENLTPTTMRVTYESLMRATAGMNPVQFESYCERNDILTEWLDVTLTNFNDGIYHITLPQYRWRCVYALNGSPIEFQ